jgi:hypothetical protein
LPFLFALPAGYWLIITDAATASNPRSIFRFAWSQIQWCMLNCGGNSQNHVFKESVAALASKHAT